MKYLRLTNGAVLPFYDMIYTNAWIIKIREVDASPQEIRSFFGKNMVMELDLLDENKKLTAVKPICASYSGMYFDVEKEIITEYRIVREAQIVPLLDEFGNQIIHSITHEPLTTIIPEETETIEKINEIPMIYVILEKPNLESEIASLKEKAGIINPNTLTLSEYKNYYKNLLGEKCTAAISGGCDVTLPSSDTPAHFSFTNADQRNIKNLYDTAKDSRFTVSLPYHCDGGYCMSFSSADIAAIYSSMQTFITSHTAYCNMLNRMVDESNSLEDVKQILYGMPLPSDKQEAIAEMVGQVETALKILSDKKEDFVCQS